MERFLRRGGDRGSNSYFGENLCKTLNSYINEEFLDSGASLTMFFFLLLAIITISIKHYVNLSNTC